MSPLTLNGMAAFLLALGSAAVLSHQIEEPSRRAPQSSHVQTQRGATELQRSTRVQILAGGDVTLGHHLAEYLEERHARGGVSGTELQSYPFRRIARRTREADIFWINLEGTLTRQTTPTPKNFNFRARPEEVAILLAAGVDVACLANNHAFDYGVQGLQETLETLAQAGIQTYGAGANLSQARKPAVLVRHGLRMGFLGYLYLGAHSVEPAAIYATTHGPGVAGTSAHLDTLLHWVRQDVSDLRTKVDLLLVSFHWGREGHLLANREQRRLAQTAAAAGADIIVGHHPHNLQGYEQIGSTLVVYSLGNLVFGGNWNPARKESALLQIDVRGRKEGRVPWTFRFLPLRVDHLPNAPFQPYFLEGADARRVHHWLDCISQARREAECETHTEARPRTTP